jgi:type III restriction enzyme
MAPPPVPPNRVIDNPVINSPFAEPARHFAFDDAGITDDIAPGRRSSSYFVPIARPKKKGKQLVFDTEWTQDRIEENQFINDVRRRVGIWREGGYAGVTKTTLRLLEYWRDPERERKLFFCQIEALETLIYISECAKKFDAWIDNDLRKACEQGHSPLPRLACKMATGSGKTVVMAMLIAWQTLNKLANPQDARFGDAFLIVTPGITIRDRLRVLLPNDPYNYYRERDLLPAGQLVQLEQAKIVITNYHAFQLRERENIPKLNKLILNPDNPDAFKESPDQMVRRVCRELGTKRQIIVLNDEAHHCYRGKPAEAETDSDESVLKGDDRKEAKKRNEEARIWISGLEAVQNKIGVKAVYDLSATPFFLRGSGYREGTLFPWVVSDFSLIDAIESGIVKVPRVPVADNSMQGERPTYRDLWERIRDKGLPKKGRKTEAVSGEPKLPADLEGALHSLYGNYCQSYERWRQSEHAQLRGLTPPVFIVVCNNTNVSKLVYDYIAGWEKTAPNGEPIVQTGKLPIFRNDDERGGWLARPNTILIDSEQLESGEAMSAEFKKIAAREIEEFKSDYRRRFPGRDAEQLTDEDLLREVMNTVGKPGRLGEQVKCVVSVSMLTEGWDANTVTHILGVRAFGTQLLCEQVVGRGLRRMSYTVNEHGLFDPEYAEVYGVPFSFIPCSGQGPNTPPGPTPTRVRALDERIDCEMTFPRVLGYRYDIRDRELRWQFTPDCHYALSTRDLPTQVENAPIVGRSELHTLDDLKQVREQQVAFTLAKLVLEKYFRQDAEPRADRPAQHDWDAEVQVWRFPQVLAIAREWLEQCVTCKDGTFKQLLMFVELAHDAADRIYQSIVKGTEQERLLLPLLQPYDTTGSTRWVDFDTTKPTYATLDSKCHISHVVADTGSWEQKMAQVLEEMPEVVRYVKNHNLGFFIPYTIGGDERRYVPDFLVDIDDASSALAPWGERVAEGRERGNEQGEPLSGRADEGNGVRASDGAAASDNHDYLHVIVEVTGERKKEKAAKVATARNFWIPAINHHGGFGRWAFVEIADPWDNAADVIRSHVADAMELTAETRRRGEEDLSADERR